MSFNWSDYLVLAKELAGESDEARLRSAISRAYYAVFCKARNYLRDVENKPIPSTSIAHGIVIEALKAHPNKDLRQVGVDLDRLRTDRKKADYDDNFSNIVTQVEMDLIIAQESYKVLETM